MKFIVSVALIMFSITLYSQDLTGVWIGKSTNAAGNVEMAIEKKGDEYIGYTYDYGSGHCRAHYKGKYNEEKKLMTGDNVGMIEKTPEHHQCTYRLYYVKRDDGEYLYGYVGNLGMQFLLALGSGDRVWLKKVSSRIEEYVDTTINKYRQIPPRETPVIEKQDTVRKEPPVIEKEPPVIEKDPALIKKEERKSDTISRIITQDPKIKITLFDNGQIDGDTITILHNNTVLLSKHFVSGKPYELEITLDPKTINHQFTLIAENLGSIPPNTAVVIIETGGKKYRLTASTDLKKNSVIMIDYR